jgi:hypothetical protein
MLQYYLPVINENVNELVGHLIFPILFNRGCQEKEVIKMGAIAKAAVIKNRRDKKDEKKE